MSEPANNNAAVTAIQRIRTWFAGQCDGDWEHQNGVKIETTDNPGWSVKIDLDNATANRLEGCDGMRDGLSWAVADGVLYGYDEQTGNIEGLLTLMADLIESKHPCESVSIRG